MKKIFVLLTIAVSLFSCGNGRKTTVREEGDTLSFKYARLIEVVRYANHTEVNIKNPWKDGKTLHRYCLVPSAETSQQAVDDGMTLVRVPLQRSIVFTSVHAALLGQLDAGSQVTGVADLKYMKVP